MFYCFFVVFKSVFSVSEGDFFLDLRRIGSMSGYSLLRFGCLCHSEYESM